MKLPRYYELFVSDNCNSICCHENFSKVATVNTLLNCKIDRSKNSKICKVISLSHKDIKMQISWVVMTIVYTKDSFKNK